MKMLKAIYLALRGVALFPVRMLVPARRPQCQKMRKVLIVRTDRVGDMVLSTPFFSALHAALPQAELVLLAKPFARDLLCGNPDIGRIMDWEPSRRDAIVSALQSERFDLAIDMHYDYDLSTAMLCRESAAEYAAGFDIAGRGAFFNVRVPASGKKHFLDETSDILSALGLEHTLRPPRIYADPGGWAAAREFLLSQGVPRDARIALIHPGGFYPEQRWPAERFAALADLLAEKYALSPCVIGSADEERLCASLVAAARRKPALFVGRSLRELAALFEKSVFFVGNNSGPLHLAAAFGVPTLTTMGPTDPVRWQPFGPANSVVCKRDLTDITVEEMAAEIQRRLH